jgi:hypothetical protein
LTNKIIQDIWILSEGGIVVFNRVFNPKINEQLFGALMTALNSFAEELIQGGPMSFELSAVRYTIYKTNTFLFIANSSKKIKEKSIKEELRKVSEKFFIKYSKTLENWDYEISVFSDFEPEIEDSLEETIKKFEKAFW